MTFHEERCRMSGGLRALDLFCGAGGASRGLDIAGFDVTGVDIKFRKNYPYNQVVQDALTVEPSYFAKFDFIWASPPCQGYTWAAKGHDRKVGRVRANLLPQTRDMLAATGKPFVIENVVGAPLRPDLVLTGQMFGLRVIRRRHFELSGFWALQPPPHRPGRIGFGPKDFVSVAGHGGDGSGRLSNWKDAMGIDWMTKEELVEAIPPAYSEFIGRAAIAHIQQARAA